jgi:hypothetical protein
MTLPPSASFKSAAGKYLTALPDGTVHCKSETVGPDQTFLLLPSRGAYSLKAANGKYVCSEPNAKVVANRDNAQEWETLTIYFVDVDAQNVVIRGDQGRWFSVKGDGSVASDGPNPGDFAEFTIAPAAAPQTARFAGKNKLIRSVHGKYLSAQPTGKLDWDRANAAEWERFEFIHVQGNVYNIKGCHGKYVCAEPDGKVVVNRDGAAQWERFTVEVLPSGKIGLKTDHGKYVSAQPNGTVEGNRGALGEWETFEVG